MKSAYSFLVILLREWCTDRQKEWSHNLLLVGGGYNNEVKNNDWCFADDQQKKLRCQKIKENRKRRGVTPASGSSGPVMSADSSDNASLSPDAQKTSISCSTAGHECKPGEQTHVIASTVDRSILQGLPNWCTERLEEVGLSVSWSESLIDDRDWCWLDLQMNTKPYCGL